MNSFTGALGMAEQEFAASRIVRVCSGRRSWQVPINLDTFNHDIEREGFLNLLHHGWLMSHPLCDNAAFAVSKRLVAKLKSTIRINDGAWEPPLDTSAKLKLTAGRFYKSKDSEVWCCFRVTPEKPEHARADCIRLADSRIEYFFLDGRYDSGGKREHTLIEEVDHAVACRS